MRQKRAPRTTTPRTTRRGASRPQPRHSRAPALAILVVVGLVAIGIGLGMRALRENAPKVVASGPNIVVIVLDDLDTYTWDKLPELSSLLGGRVFPNAYTANGSGSASRMEMLTGQYAHNNGVLSDKAPIGGFARSVRNGAEKLTVAVALQRAGYETGLVGEYLDGYGVSSADADAGVQATYVPPGWDSWYAISGIPAYTGFTISADGTVAQPGGYLTSDLASRAVAFLTDGDPAPHFLWLAPLAVRLPAEPATQYADAKVNTTLPGGEKDVTDKPSFLSSLKPDDPKQVGAQQADRLRTLLSIVDLVRQVRTAAGSDAVIILTSDGGFHLGQNSLPVGNGTAYEPDIRVPLVIAGGDRSSGPIRAWPRAWTWRPRSPRWPARTCPPSPMARRSSPHPPPRATCCSSSTRRPACCRSTTPSAPRTAGSTSSGTTARSSSTTSRRTRTRRRTSPWTRTSRRSTVSAWRALHPSSTTS